MIPFEAKFDNQFESKFHKYTKTRKAKVYLQFSFVAMKILHLLLYHFRFKINCGKDVKNYVVERAL